MSSYSDACTMDVPPTARGRSIPESRRWSQRNLAHRIARQRLAHPNQQDQYQDGSNLLFRRNVLVEDDWDQYFPYLNVSFLDQHDTVVASDTYGRIDVIRLPRYCPPCHEESTQPSRLIGQQLADRLEVNHQSVHSEGTFVKLKSLQGGQAFAAGMPSGHFQVFATEHATTWGKRNLSSAQKVSLDRPEQMTRAYSRQEKFVSHAWTVEGPRRRYPREDNIPTRSLRRMAQNGISQSSGMMELAGWNTAGSEHYNIGLKERVENCRMWDFRETPSALLAAHIDRYRDCFSLRVMDGRCNHESNKAIMCIDMSSKDSVDLSTKKNSIDVREQINAICFASDRCLATAHEQFINDGIHTSSSVKWWDMRMIQREQAKPTAKTVVPSFPLNPACCIEPCADFEPIDISRFPRDSESNIPALIHSLTPSVEGVGTILLTLNSYATPNHGVEHIVIDPVRPCALQTIHTNQHMGLHPFATTITPNHDFMASLSFNSQDGGRSIALYDLSRKSMFHQNKEKKMDGTTPVSRKRPSSDLLDNDRDADSRLIGSIPVNITDRHGMRSGLSCMALNDTGSALVCGSEDGDLFLWRGG